MEHALTQEKPAICRIQVRGRVSQRIANNVGLSVSVSDEADRIVTTLSGQVADQAALMGILNGLYDMGYRLLFIESNLNQGGVEGDPRLDKHVAIQDLQKQLAVHEAHCAAHGKTRRRHERDIDRVYGRQARRARPRG